MAKLEGWNTLHPERASDLAEARLLGHFAVQVASSPGLTHLPEAPRWAHASLSWSADGGGVLAGRPVQGLRTALHLATLRWMVLGDDGGVHAFEDAIGRSVYAGLAWTRDVLSEHGVRPLPMLTGDYGMPDHPLCDGAPLGADDPSGLVELSACFENADMAVRAATDGFKGAGDVAIWPHHFDLSRRIDLGGRQSVVVGLSPGDDQVDQPYFYVYRWPALAGGPPAVDLPAGRWTTLAEGFFGAILPISELPADGEAQASLVTGWLATAAAACGANAG